MHGMHTSSGGTCVNTMLTTHLMPCHVVLCCHRDLLEHNSEPSTPTGGLAPEASCGPILGGSGAGLVSGFYSPRPATAGASGYRSCLKLTENSFRSSIQGAGLEVIAEVGGGGMGCVGKTWDVAVQCG